MHREAHNNFIYNHKEKTEKNPNVMRMFMLIIICRDKEIFDIK